MSPARLAEGCNSTAAHVVVADRHEARPESTPEELAVTDAPVIEEIARCPRCGYCGKMEHEAIGPSAGGRLF